MILKKAFPVVLIIIGVILLSTPFLTEEIIKYHQKNLEIEKITNKDIIANIEEINNDFDELEPEDFDFSLVQDIDIMSVIKGSLNFDKKYIIGLLLIPDLNMDLPIFKGVSNANLVAGVGTLRKG